MSVGAYWKSRKIRALLPISYGNGLITMYTQNTHNRNQTLIQMQPNLRQSFILNQSGELIGFLPNQLTHIESVTHWYGIPINKVHHVHVLPPKDDSATIYVSVIYKVGSYVGAPRHYRLDV